MKIKLDNFRCHKKASFNIPDAGLVLLSGTSGIGKTTILNAIVYALYGKLAKPYSHDQTKCSVTLEGYRIPGSGETLNIRRTSPGSRLNVECGGVGYEDGAAQGLIDSLLVSHEKFLLSSYVVQRLQSSILSLPPRDQVVFIKALASVGDSDNVFRARIQNKLGYYEGRAAHLQGESSVLGRQFDAAPSGGGAPPQTDALPGAVRSAIHRLELDINQTRETIGKLEGAKLRLQNEVDQAAQAANLEKQIAALRAQLAAIDFCDDSEIESLEREGSFLKRALAFRNETLNLQRLEANLVRPDMHQHALLSPEAHDSYQKEIQTLRRGHATEAAAAAVVAAAKKEVSAIADQANARWKTKLKPGPAALQAFFDKKERQLKKRAAQTRQETETETLAQKASSPDVYACPGCDIALVIDGTKLTTPPKAAPGKPADYGALLLELRAQAVQIEADLAACNDLNSRFGLVSAQAKSKVLCASKLALYLKKIGKLEKAIHLSEKSRAEIEAAAEAETMLSAHRKKAETILHEGDKNALAALEGDGDPAPRLDRLVETLARKRVNKERAVALSAVLQEKQSKRDRCRGGTPAAAEELGQVAGRLETAQLHYRGQVAAFQQAQKELEGALEWQSYQTAVQRRATLLKEKEAVETALKIVHNKLLGFRGLNSLCKKADIASTDATIADINFNASFYTKELFVDPIQVALSRVRTTLKGAKRDGMTTNVVYKGAVYSNLDQLSGGERQRCNLAFILGVNDIVGSPFLLLDECLNNLDGETHAIILDFLRQTCQGKLILVVAHEAAVAKFDEVVMV